MTDGLRTRAGIKTLTRVDLHGSGEPGVNTGRCFTIAGVQRPKALPNLRMLWLTNVEATDGYLGLKELTASRIDTDDPHPDGISTLKRHCNTINATGGGDKRSAEMSNRARRTHRLNGVRGFGTSACLWRVSAAGVIGHGRRFIRRSDEAMIDEDETYGRAAHR